MGLWGNPLSRSRDPYRKRGCCEREWEAAQLSGGTPCPQCSRPMNSNAWCASIVLCPTGACMPCGYLGQLSPNLTSKAKDVRKSHSPPSLPQLDFEELMRISHSVFLPFITWKSIVPYFFSHTLICIRFLTFYPALPIDCTSKWGGTQSWKLFKVTYAPTKAAIVAWGQLR